MALDARHPQHSSLVHHSDRGVQYACGDYTDLLTAQGLVASMSGIGNPYDNAKVESFMKTLKQEIDGKSYRNLRHATRNIGSFIEQVYNRQRLHSALDYRSPLEFEPGHATPIVTVWPPPWGFQVMRKSTAMSKEWLPCPLRKRAGALIRPPALLFIAVSFHRLFLGGLLPRRARFRFAGSLPIPLRTKLAQSRVRSTCLQFRCLTDGAQSTLDLSQVSSLPETHLVKVNGMIV